MCGENVVLCAVMSGASHFGIICRQVCEKPPPYSLAYAHRRIQLTAMHIATATGRRADRPKNVLSGVFSIYRNTGFRQIEHVANAADGTDHLGREFVVDL